MSRREAKPGNNFVNLVRIFADTLRVRSRAIK